MRGMVSPVEQALAELKQALVLEDMLSLLLASMGTQEHSQPCGLSVLALQPGCDGIHHGVISLGIMPV
jgi:hypothetical protein